MLIWVEKFNLNFSKFFVCISVQNFGKHDKVPQKYSHNSQKIMQSKYWQSFPYSSLISFFLVSEERILFFRARESLGKWMVRATGTPHFVY